MQSDMDISKMNQFIYIGKSIDSFETVWNAWLRSFGITEFIHVDCVSFRCFAFICKTSPENWFQPAEESSDFMNRLVRHLGMEKECIIQRAGDYRMTDIGPDRWLLLAQVKLNALSENVRSQFYHGTPQFALVKRKKNENRFLCTSSGIPYMELSADEMETMLNDQNAYIASMRDIPSIRQVSADFVLREGIRWRESKENLLERIEKFDFAIKDAECVTHKIAFQYGLQNYQIQRSKVLRFCVEKIGISDVATGRLSMLLQQIPEVNLKSAEEIHRIERKFWQIIEEWREL